MIADTFAGGLRQKQIDGALKIWQERRVILADQPGSGKTAQALVALELDGQLGRRANILITTVQTACQLTWAGELENRVATQHDVVIADLTKPGISARTGLPKRTIPSLAEREGALAESLMIADAMDQPLVVLANFEMLRAGTDGRYVVPTLADIVWDAIIVDESHLVLPTKEDDRSKMTQFWRGLSGLQTSEDPILLPISGTPDRGKLENRYGTYKFLWKGQFTNFWGWARSQFVVTPGEWGGAEIGKLRSPETWARFQNQVVIRRTKAEMLEGMPAKMWAGDGAIELDMTPEQAKAYSDFQADIEAEAEQLRADEKFAEADALRFTFYLRARQMATCTWDIAASVETDASGKEHRHTHATPKVRGPEHSNKLAWILEWLESRGYTQGNWDPTLGKVVIVSYFTEVLKWLRSELAAAGVRAELLTGESAAADKSAVEESFQRGDLRVVLLSGHLGVSINLDAADDMIFVDMVNDPDKLEQAEDRIHRASRFHQTTYWRLVSKGTADVAILAAADHAYRTTRTSYEGSRGVDFARRFLGKMLDQKEMA